MNGADALCDTLLAGGVDVCFANPGTSEMHFVAALDRKPQMRCVLGLFEGVVTGAADGYARMADKPAATLLHTGPGLANALANIHNAKRGWSPMINIVGDHATHHLVHDAPLTSDIEMLAKPMSHWVKTTKRAQDVSRDAAEAIVAARTPPGQIATLILPADAAWSQTSGEIAAIKTPPPRGKISADAIQQALNAIRSGKKTAIMLTGAALRAKPMETASRIANKTGVRLLSQQANARIARGAGRVAISRVPYPVAHALEQLKDLEHLILIGAKAPVGFFAYPGMPSVMTPPGCQIHPVAAIGDDLVQALDWLADELGATAHVEPTLQKRQNIALPTGPLSIDTISLSVAALLPENAIICDEAVTSGRSLFKFTDGAAQHDHLQTTGGAIGLGLPMAVGAAIACPDRKVVSLQADGSGMYTCQALWTQAREALDIVTVVYANRSYAILHGELKAVGAGEPGRNARRMLDLDQPAIDWTSMAKGMGVDAVRATTADEFNKAFEGALATRGPFLIEAAL